MGRFNQLFLWGLMMVSASVQAANECRVQYKYKNSTGNETTKTVNINAGETKTLNIDRLVYLKNLKTREVNAWVNNYQVKLGKNVVDPANGFHLARVRLKKVKCLSSNPQQPIDLVVQQFKNAGKSASFIARHLKNSLRQNERQIASLLKNVRFTTQQIVIALKSAGYSHLAVGNVLKSVLKVGAKTAAIVLKGAGYSLINVADVLKVVFRQTEQRVAYWLKQADYTQREVSFFLLRHALMAAHVYFTTMINLYNASADFVVGAAKQANRGATEVAKALSDVYRLSTSRIESILRRAGYSLVDIGEALEQFAESDNSSTKSNSRRPKNQPVNCPKGKRMVNGRCI
ncbi:hypothetical protein FLL45_09070 [Aliikangiella marina]|uniref:Uncharacterized protein n=1 Tax=Aliikangiella marina TaxID=1712262 RepID=A0A545TCX9_9GAMM|nr:hypothetical protein [Aliikangiella marina]TQV75082.1 hypothetical protein FLL45_09070 [Aliikangiella marina]